MIDLYPATEPVMPEQENIRVGIVEDEAELREGFAFLVRRSSGLTLERACASGEEALQTLATLEPAVVLMDVQLPGMDGIECIRRFKEQSPETQFIVLTVFENDDVIFRAIEAGASGYILKTASPDKVLGAIRELHDGGAPMSAQIARRVVERFRIPAARSAAIDRSEWALTNRERDVLGLLAQGYLYKEIAERLAISVDTVRKHLGRVYRKLHVKSRTEAVLKVFGR